MRLQLDPVPPLVEIRIAMDDLEADDQPIPVLTDVEGLLESEKCDGLTFEITLDGKSVDFFYLKEGAIYLSPPALKYDDLISDLPHEGMLQVKVPEAILTLHFDVYISGPDCSKLTIANSGPLNYMEITIGGNSVTQLFVPFRDSIGFMQNGYC